LNEDTVSEPSVETPASRFIRCANAGAAGVDSAVAGAGVDSAASTPSAGGLVLCPAAAVEKEVGAITRTLLQVEVQEAEGLFQRD
jgi:hypothetical protein